MRTLSKLVWALLPAAAFAQDLKPLLDTVKQAAQPDKAMEYVRRIHSTDRWSTFPKYAETAEYLRRTLAANGLERVEVINAPADGVSQFGYWTMPLAWNAKSATLEIVEPAVPADKRELANFEKIPTSLVMWSGPTPARGVVAEVVEYATGADLKGKLVLTKQNPAGLKYDLAKAGALGAVNTFTENPKLEDGRQWINSWGDYGWAYTAKSTPLVGFSLSPREAAYLRSLMAKGPVKLRAKVDSRHYKGYYPYVTAVIPGETDEEVLTLGHSAEQGAHDNATGVAAMLESVSTIRRLINEGKLKKPRRTIRMMAMPEYYGTHHYIATYPDRIKRTVAAMCVDTPAATYDLPGTEYTWYLNPWSGYSYTDPFILKLAATYFPTVNRKWHWKEFMAGTDAFLGEPSIGVPATWPYSGTGVHTHHNSADTPDTVDVQSLRDLIVMNAAYLYYFADAGEKEAQWLARIAREWGAERKLPEHIVEQMVQATARLTGAARPPKRRPASPGTVITRKRFGTLPLDDIPPDEREGYPNGAWVKHPTLALYWADGRRNLDEIVALTKEEAGETKFDYAGYFAFLAKKGYIEMTGAAPAAAQQQAGDAGQKSFANRCAFCHGADGRGGERAPDVTRSIRTRNDLPELIRNGIPDKGMPGANVSDTEMTALLAYMRTLRPARAGNTGVTLTNRGPSMAQVIDPPVGEWPSYHGQLSGNRHSPLTQITPRNVGQLTSRWMFSVPGAPRLQVTPTVVDGVMYVTAPNEAYALDAATGKTLWSFRRPRTRGVVGDAASGINRGVALLEDRLFLITDNAHLLALDRRNGRLIWDTEMADYRQNYGATSAPLVIGDLVVSGHSGGDEGARGFLAAFDVKTGKEAWRFWTVPAPGEPGSETWQGRDWEHGCAATWLTGTYDPTAGILYWTTGNPCPDYNGDERRGDNLYSDSVVALDAKTGKLRWHFQHTPHDLHDWDSQQTAMLVDAEWKGRPRKLLIQANRNGFFYVLDRLTGEFLLGKPFVKRLTWATGLDEKGRPIKSAGADPTPEGIRACPAVEGATNWMSTAYSPATKLFYVMTLEKCTFYTKAKAEWKAGQSHYGGDTRNIPEEKGQKILRALNIQTGEVVWELPQDGPAITWGGVLSTAGGVVFFGHDDGSFAAADAKSGKLLWQFQANQLWKASPMTYQLNGKQYVATAAGPNVLVFALP
ncbi:MAG: PQQ-dependent dehydrogenase, methanol/ethanol family [Bryobacterales bacterium]|nr:PQQ-dependent dehydrogenase, methanol/ethanol family [Bryobacterales bacterium]